MKENFNTSLFACFISGNQFSDEGPNAEDGFFLISAKNFKKAVGILEEFLAAQGKNGLQPFGCFGPELEYSKRGGSMNVLVYRVVLVGECTVQVPIFIGPVYRSFSSEWQLGETWMRDSLDAEWYRET